jgi:photosystem II stability/assembly factor-like uncharacterized protein
MAGRRLAWIGSAVAGMLLALPAAAGAHGLVQRANLPIPEWLFGTAAALVLVVSFVALAVLWSRPRLEGSDGWRPLPRLGHVLGSPALEAICQAIGVLLLVVVLVAGFAGVQEPGDNFAPTFVYITFWVGVAFASAVFGDVFRAFNPWRAVRVRGRRPYPERLGRWPAALGLLGFAWLELASEGWGQQPDILAAAVAVYTAITLGAMAVWGTEAWIERGETFSVYFNLFSRLSPFERRGHVVGVRPPLSALTRLDRDAGTVAVVLVMIGTVTFDGLSQGSLWANVADRLDDVISSERLIATIGIGLSVAAVAGFYSLGVLGARSVGGEQTVERLRRAFVHSLVPIALVYVAAHYFTFLAFEGQGIAALASDPLGKGWNLFGTASDAIDYGVISQNQTWYAQVAFVVAGHVAALILAHERALVVYDKAKLAVRSQYWMLGVMVGFTSLALWLLAQAGTALTVKEAKASATATRSARLVDFSKKPPYVNGLEIDPGSSDFLLTTNRGFWRIKRDGAVSKVIGSITYHGKKDTVGTFLVVKPTAQGRLIGSGHPDHNNTLPQFLGYIASDDGGRSWRALARMGDADLHKIVNAGRRMYAYDAVLSAILSSDDGGRSFTEHFTPRGLVIDFVVDPADRDHLLAANDDELFRSHDGGDSWKPVVRARRMRLAWTNRLYRADQDGRVYVSADAARTWKQTSRLEGEPYKWKATADPRHLYLALSDGTIMETRDGAATWNAAFRP